ncbi:GyrI-like domain-containing protein [Arthrobacter sp. MDT1-65]
MKTDFRKEIGTYTARRGRFEVVKVPVLRFLMIDGQGDPNTSDAYRDAVTSIYPVAYALKFLSKGELGRDYTVMPLEALWWSEDMAFFTAARDASRWDWTVMIMVPDWTTSDQLETAYRTVARRGGAPALDALRLEELDEGLAVQTLHLGPYDTEGPVLEALHADYLPSHALQETGKHHEIYLGDARRTPPARLRTILRQPVAPMDGRARPDGPPPTAREPDEKTGRAWT